MVPAVRVLTLMINVTHLNVFRALLSAVATNVEMMVVEALAALALLDLFAQPTNVLHNALLFVTEENVEAMAVGAHVALVLKDSLVQSTNVLHNVLLLVTKESAEMMAVEVRAVLVLEDSPAYLVHVRKFLRFLIPHKIRLL